MIVTESQLMTFQKIRDDIHQHPEKSVVPSKEEVKRMESVRYNMSADAYLTLPEEERKKWYINLIPTYPHRFLRFDEQKKENLYSIGFYFEPWDPSILNRKY